MKRVLLINPATPGFAMRLFPPLSLAVLAGAIPDRHDVSIIDENVEDLTLDGDLAAITANTYSVRRAYEIAGMFRRRGVPVVLGGNHPSILSQEAAAYADSVVIGDGETVWPELLSDLDRLKLKRFYAPERYGFDRSLVPRRDLLSNRYRFDSLETVRGCPFDCDFCSVTRFHGAVCRMKPLDLIERELRQLSGKTLFLVDDNFLGVGDAGRTQAMLGLFRQYGIRWMGQASINVADRPELLRAARESGCIFLFIGFESLNPEVLRSLNKQLNSRRGVSSYREVIQRVHEQGISVMGSFIIGTDHDTRDSIRELREFIRVGGIDIPNITHLTPYPGTKVYEALCRDKRLFDERFWLRDPVAIFTFEPRHISVAELLQATVELISDQEGIVRGARRFFSTLKHTRSIRTASFSLAAGALSVGTLRQGLSAFRPEEPPGSPRS